MEQQQGFSLLEVLVSMLVLSIALLGYSKAQFVALQNVRAAYYYSAAANQITVLHEQLTAEPKALAEYLSAWNAENARLLPQGQGSLSAHTIKLTWQGSANQQTSAGAEPCYTAIVY